ncbi:hypothetical protein JG688_00009624 [Phytophthora aleatoria]|uniref:Uncharacterized protein n=1 Tax=Phytophthora aleatoria TaxID=2496075 RepID=A0A8J5J372_9STRA|nr:hypothetical protein JG688_00009624 [Phytophthora aleatoria]
MGVWVPPSRDGYGGTLRFRDAQDDRYCYVRTEVNDKKVAHFARFLRDALMEFAAMNKDNNPLDLTLWDIQPMTVEVLQTIRDQSALLFRCLYNISGEKKALDLATHFFFE